MLSVCVQNLMREYMRNNDRALSNIEALPGGFNALRQLYENVQVCMLPAVMQLLVDMPGSRAAQTAVQLMLQLHLNGEVFGTAHI
jgi:hypothetical protein